MRLPFRAVEPQQPEAEPVRRLAPIRIFGADTEVRGWVLGRDERMTDVLQRGEELSFLPDGARDEPESWIRLAPDEMRLVIPPPHVSALQLRVPLPLQPVSIRIGAFRVEGTARLRAGQEHDPFPRASHPFLPLTHGTLLGPDRDPEPVEVVIVNLRWAEEIDAL
jgi:hypothetical protein